MNVPGIRAALERMNSVQRGRFLRLGNGDYMVPIGDPLAAAIVRVGLRACDEAEKPCLEHDNYINCAWCSHDAGQMQLLADILREAGVEVGE